MYFVSTETSLCNIKIKNYDIELNTRKLKLLYHASTVIDCIYINRVVIIHTIPEKTNSLMSHSTHAQDQEDTAKTRAY